MAMKADEVWVMKRVIRSVAQLSRESSFTEAQIRWWIQKSTTNGLEEAGGVVRIGRRVYIDLSSFDKWIDSQSRDAAKGTALNTDGGRV